MERCVTCHYYDRHNGKANEGKASNAGQCRKAAPHLNPINAKTYMIEGVWPTVRDDDWCGEWKALVRRVDPSRINEVLNANGAVPARLNGETPSRATVVNAPAQPSARPVAFPSVSAPKPSPAAAAASAFAMASGRGD